MSRAHQRIISRYLKSTRHFASNPTTKPLEYDVVVVGGGIIGVGSARELQMRYKDLRMAVVEKENALAVHQSGHNSGVLHAGIYYTPGSLKAKLCVEGMQLMFDYCEKKNVPYKKVGKLIVATNPTEVERLEDLKKRAAANNVRDVKMLEGEQQIQEIEPHCKGLKALWSPHTSIVDYVAVTNHYAEDFKELGGKVHFNFKVNKFHEGNDSNYPVVLSSEKGETIKTKYVLTCAGLYSDKVAEMSGCSPYPKIIPFRGEYLLLTGVKRKLVEGNIYPVPDPRFPFLGVHFTPRLDGSMWLGPNAVLAFRREGYKYSDVNISELLEALTYSGFRKLALKYASAGLDELRKSIFTRYQVKELQRFVPDVTVKDVKTGPAGVRAQALDKDGNLVDDFAFDIGEGPIAKRILHCRNVPSPGATSSLAIAKMIADKFQAKLLV